MVKMAEKRDYYEILGIARDATEKQIADAYRKHAIKNHPDKNPGDEEAIVRFKLCAEAFEVLSDRDRRGAVRPLRPRRSRRPGERAFPRR